MSAPRSLARADAAPSGWKLAPLKITDEMMAAGDKFPSGSQSGWSAMLAAAPATPPMTPLSTPAAQGTVAGWKLVPLEPTREMLAAAGKYADYCAVHNYGGPPDAEGTWDAMLAAAPASPPASGWNTDLAAAKEQSRILLLWKAGQGFPEHVELGWWSAEKGWVNTYGNEFSGAPDAWAPLAPFEALPARTEAMDADEIKQRILGALDDYRDAGPEEGESWESWYYAAFDLASEKIAGLLNLLTTPPDEAPEALPASGVDELAYRFWSIHPKELDPYRASMPEGYKGGVRAWFFALGMRKLMADMESALSASRMLIENINEFGHVTDAVFLNSAADRIAALSSAPAQEDGAKDLGWHPRGSGQNLRGHGHE